MLTPDSASPNPIPQAISNNNSWMQLICISVRKNTMGCGWYIWMVGGSEHSGFMDDLVLGASAKDAALRILGPDLQV